MNRSFLIVGVILAIILLNVLRQRERNQKRDKALIEQFMPAKSSMSETELTRSAWAYSGPLGELTLHFDAGGKLRAEKEGQTEEGTWKVESEVVHAQIPGAPGVHQGFFRTSIDELIGLSPRDLEPKRWTARRLP